MSKHLVIHFNKLGDDKYEIVAQGDTYGAKDVLKAQGWKFRKVGYESEWYKQGTEQEINASLLPLAALVPEDVEYMRQWSIEVVLGGGRTALYLVNAGQFIPAKWEQGKVVKA